jgi:tetratricopeptide (TPR) repeat protein
VDKRPRKLSAPVMPAPIAAPGAAPAAPAPPPGVPYADDDEKTMNLLATEFLTFRGKDPFDLLGMPLDVQAAPLQKAFLAKANALTPVRFKSADSRGKAEVLLAAYARAFGALADHESYLLQRKRRETLEAQKKNGGAKANTAAQQFRIRTDLLDAKQQFDEGKKRFDAGNFKGAVEHFEYACDIEPRAKSLAWLALARYRQSPQSYAPKALAELADACNREPACEEAWAFRGDLAMAFGRHEEADESYRKAIKLAPTVARYTEALKKLAPLLKK